MNTSGNKITSSFKVDIRTPLEQFFLGLIILSPLFIWIGYSQMQVGDSPLIMQGAIIGLIVGLICSMITDNYYIFDSKKQLFIYHFHFFIYTKNITKASFSQISKASLDTMNLRSKNGHRFNMYKVQIILRNGKKIVLTDALKKLEVAQGIVDNINKRLQYAAQINLEKTKV